MSAIREASSIEVTAMAEMSQREQWLCSNNLDWYVVEYDDGEIDLKHKTELSSILECGIPTEDFGILSVEQCWNGEDLRGE